MTVKPKTPGLRLRVTAAAETIVRGGHPWVFANSVREQNRPGKCGELAVIFDRNNKFLAIGLFDPDSPIRVRVLHAGKPQPINAAWWRAQAARAMAQREKLFDSTTTGYRCINGESDGWPGLVLDRYDTAFVIKIYSAAWLAHLAEILPALHLAGQRIILRLSRNIASMASADFSLTDGQILQGPPVSGPVIFQETGIRFEAEVLRGQKTGFFLDQRENRRHVEGLAVGRKVLNLFSYSGGFSLYAARGGATSVTSLDLSEHALASARRNFALNEKIICPHETIQADAFLWLREKATRHFDLIVLDPPSLAKRAAEREDAMRAYTALISAASHRLNPGGILVAASCSAHVTAADFFQLARESAQKSARTFEEIRTTHHAPDHPATFPEAEYLKCIYLKFP